MEVSYLHRDRYKKNKYQALFSFFDKYYFDKVKNQQKEKGIVILLMEKKVSEYQWFIGFLLLNLNKVYSLFYMNFHPQISKEYFALKNELVDFFISADIV